MCTASHLIPSHIGHIKVKSAHRRTTAFNDRYKSRFATITV